MSFSFRVTRRKNAEGKEFILVCPIWGSRVLRDFMKIDNAGVTRYDTCMLTIDEAENLGFGLRNGTVDVEADSWARFVGRCFGNFEKYRTRRSMSFDDVYDVQDYLRGGLNLEPLQRVNQSSSGRKTTIDKDSNEGFDEDFWTGELGW